MQLNQIVYSSLDSFILNFHDLSALCTFTPLFNPESVLAFMNKLSSWYVFKSV